MKWDKRQLHRLLLEKLRAELQATMMAAEVAKEGATHEDAVAKSKYDTHGLELSYLAGSQFERARNAEAKASLLENTLFKEFSEDDDIDVGALVLLKNPVKTQPYLVSSLGAGLELEWNAQKIVVISPDSPLGEMLMGLSLGDRIEAKEGIRSNYEIVGLY